MIARLVAQAASGAGALGEESGLAARLADAGSLARWAGLWETLQRSKADADALNLDRKTFVLETFFQLEAVARRN